MPTLPLSLFLRLSEVSLPRSFHAPARPTIQSDDPAEQLKGWALGRMQICATLTLTSILYALWNKALHSDQPQAPREPLK